MPALMAFDLVHIWSIFRRKKKATKKQLSVVYSETRIIICLKNSFEIDLKVHMKLTGITLSNLCRQDFMYVQSSLLESQHKLLVESVSLTYISTWLCTRLGYEDIVWNCFKGKATEYTIPKCMLSILLKNTHKKGLI